MSNIMWSTPGRLQRRDRRFQVRAWKRGDKYAEGSHTYHRTKVFAGISATMFAAFGWQVELWDRSEKGN